MYFDNCITAEEVKELYRKLAKKLHPDCGGDPEEFKRMSAEFSKVFDRLKNVHSTADGRTYTKDTGETADRFMEKINSLLHMTGCTVELIGSWIWVTGNTYTYKEELKQAGFRYASKKKAWYFHFEPFKKHSKTDFTIDDLRNTFGSTQFDTYTRPALEA